MLYSPYYFWNMSFQIQRKDKYHSLGMQNQKLKLKATPSKKASNPINKALTPTDLRLKATYRPQREQSLCWTKQQKPQLTRPTLSRHICLYQTQIQTTLLSIKSSFEILKGHKVLQPKSWPAIDETYHGKLLFELLYNSFSRTLKIGIAQMGCPNRNP